MLTLTRKPGQKIFIAGGIEIEVREIRGSQVRLGITAPLGLPVYREELYVQIADANYAAMTDVDLARLEAIDA
ncbi:MAG: carbon storage regulator [Myxococcales bacterium]|nr:carbon storage regulator [Myxococcales bacterium]